MWWGKGLGEGGMEMVVVKVTAIDAGAILVDMVVVLDMVVVMLVDIVVMGMVDIVAVVNILVGYGVGGNR